MGLHDSNTPSTHETHVFSGPPMEEQELEHRSDMLNTGTTYLADFVVRHETSKALSNHLALSHGGQHNLGPQSFGSKPCRW